MNNLHQKARTTVYSRALIVQMVLKEKRSLREVVEAWGVSRRTAYKWRARYKVGGLDALHERSSRPRRSPRRLPLERVATIAARRRWGLNRLPRREARPPVIRRVNSLLANNS